MKITTHNKTGEVALYPVSEPTARSWHTVRDVDSLPEGEGVLHWDADANGGEGALVRVVKSLDELKAAKLKQLTEARYKEEIGGFTISGTGSHLDGAFIRTDREVSQAKIAQGAIAATINPAYTTDWQMADGSIVTLDAAAIIAISMKFSEFEQAGRTKLKNLLNHLSEAENKGEVSTITW